MEADVSGKKDLLACGFFYHFDSIAAGFSPLPSSNVRCVRTVDIFMLLLIVAIVY